MRIRSLLYVFVKNVWLSIKPKGKITVKKIFGSLLMFLIPTLLVAQINKSDTLNFKADVALTGFGQSGNVETRIFRAQSNISFKPSKSLVFKTTNSYVYQEFGLQKADEDILSLNFLYLNPDRKMSPLLLGFVSTNFRRAIDLRYLLGAGMSFELLNEKNYRLKLSLTGEYEQTDFGQSNFNRAEYAGKHTIDTFRGTIWVRGRYSLLDKKVILTHESYYQPSLEKSNNYRWQADFGVELPIWKFLNFKVNYLQTYESIVIAGQKEGDKFLTFGISLKSY